MINSLKEINSFIETSFCNDIRVHEAINKIFSMFLSKDIYSAMLVEYCDHFFRRSSRVLKQNEIDECLNNVILIFKFLPDTLKFLIYYTVI